VTRPTLPTRSGKSSARDPPADAPVATDRGLSPVVGKTLELGVGVLLVALLTATFFGSVAPDYRSAVGTEVGDRTIAAAADRIETAVPTSDVVRVDRRVTVRLPDTIRGSPYRIVADGASPASVRLVHADDAVGGRIRLAVPGSAEIRGSWRSTSPSQITVTAGEGSLSVRLVDGGSDSIEGAPTMRSEPIEAAQTTRTPGDST